MGDQEERDGQGSGRNVSVSTGGPETAAAGEGEPVSRGGAVNRARSTSSSIGPEVSESGGDWSWSLAGSRLLYPEQLSATEQMLLREELGRLAQAAPVGAALQVSPGSAGTVRLFVETGIRQLSEAARTVIRQQRTGSADGGPGAGMTMTRTVSRSRSATSSGQGGAETVARGESESGGSGPGE